MVCSSALICWVAVPRGLIFARIFAKVDIRLKGSGNIGATNVTRQVGVIPGLLTLAGDILKGALPVYLALAAFGPVNDVGDIYVSAVALAAFLGHLYPIFLKFQDGGKGVATAAGCFAVVSPAAVLAAFAVFILMLLAARRVCSWIACRGGCFADRPVDGAGSAAMIAAGGILALFIFVRHRDNLKRLAAGKEPVFKLKKD